MTGRSISATTSRMMWMLSASRARRWSSLSSAVAGSGDINTVDIIHPKTKSPGGVPGLRSVSVLLGLQRLPEQPDRHRGDLGGPATTTHAGTTGGKQHETLILLAAGGECQTLAAGLQIDAVQQVSAGLEAA